MSRHTVLGSVAATVATAAATIALAAPAQASFAAGTYPTLQRCQAQGNYEVITYKYAGDNGVANGGAPQDPTSWTLYLS